MIFILGFLVAGLLTLLFLPAYGRRATRLAQRRLEMVMPLSMEEIVAERDQLRAEFAAEHRRVEQRAEAIETRHALALGELGRRDSLIGSLEAELADTKRAAIEAHIRLEHASRETREAQAELAAVSKEAFDALGVADDPKHIVDGESIVPLLKQSGPLRRDAIYWHYPHYHPGGATPYSAVREGDWRLVEFFEDNHVELYNLKDDIGETTDLAQKMPEKAAALRQKLHDWRKSVGAQLPTPNPGYDPNAPAGPKQKSPRQQKAESELLLRIAEES